MFTIIDSMDGFVIPVAYAQGARTDRGGILYRYDTLFGFE